MWPDREANQSPPTVNRRICTSTPSYTFGLNAPLIKLMDKFIFYISQRYMPLRSVTGIALLYFTLLYFTLLYFTLLQAGILQGGFPLKSLIFSIDLNLPAALWPCG
jgi:hypothetical protein